MAENVRVALSLVARGEAPLGRNIQRSQPTLEFLISISGAWMAGRQQILYPLAVLVVSVYKAFPTLGCVKVASSRRL